MNRFHQTLALLLLSLGAAVHAQAPAGEGCILAGRLAEEGRWAPRMPGVVLLDEAGRTASAADRQSLAGVRQVRLSEPALLSRCDGNNLLARGEDSAAPKAAVPAVRPGVHAVQDVGFPRLHRGGELVELRLRVAPDQIISLTR